MFDDSVKRIGKFLAESHVNHEIDCGKWINCFQFLAKIGQSRTERTKVFIGPIVILKIAEWGVLP